MAAWLLWLEVRLAVSAADEWPQFRGPDGNGHSTATGLPLTWSETENIAWKTPIPGDGHSSPVISGDQIWLTTAIVQSLSKEEQKRRLAKVSNPQGLEIAGGVSLRAICVDRSTGEILRNIELFQVDNPRADPFAQQLRLAHARSSKTAGCISTLEPTAPPAWTPNRAGSSGRTIRCNVDHQNGPGASPILWKNLLIVQYDGIDRQFVAARDKRTGDLAWKVNRSGKLPQKREFQKAYCTPQVIEDGGRVQLISPGSDWVYSYDPQTGQELWRANYGQLGFSTVPRPVVGAWDGLYHHQLHAVAAVGCQVRRDGRCQPDPRRMEVRPASAPETLGPVDRR